MANLGLRILNTGQTMMTFSKKKNVLVVGPHWEGAMDGTDSVIANTRQN